MTSLPLAVLGFLTVIIMLVLIMTKKASPLVALIAVPVVTGIIACFFMTGEDTAGMGTMERFTTNFKGLGEMITGSSGIGSVAATGVMFIFSILFFYLQSFYGAQKYSFVCLRRMLYVKK